MFSFFKKDTSNKATEQEFSFNIELIAYALAYEIANADGNIDENELSRIKKGLECVVYMGSEDIKRQSFLDEGELIIDGLSKQVDDTSNRTQRSGFTKIN